MKAVTLPRQEINRPSTPKLLRQNIDDEKSYGVAENSQSTKELKTSTIQHLIFSPHLGKRMGTV